MDEKIKTMIKWLENETRGRRWTTHLNSYKYRNITVYGAGDLGKMLIWALKESKININCIIDQRAHELIKIGSYMVYTLEEFLCSKMETDAIIVTAIGAYDGVLKDVVRKKGDLPVLFLRDMIYEF